MIDSHLLAPLFFRLASPRGVLLTLDRLTIEAQSVLNDLWSEQLIPFQLTSHHVDSLGMNEYKVRFYDSRLHSVDVSSKDDDDFRHVFRVNILSRIDRLGGPWSKVLKAKGL